MENLEDETLSNQINTLSSSLKDTIKNIIINNQNGKSSLTNEEKKVNNMSFNSFLDLTSSLFSSPDDFKPLILQKYKKQCDQISKLRNNLSRYKNDIETFEKKFDENIEEEKRKFNRSINNLASNYFDQKEIHNSNHEAQISNLEDAIYELKANYDAKLSEGLEKVAAEKKLLKKVYQSFQKNYNDMRSSIETNLLNGQQFTDDEEEEEKSSLKNEDHYNDTTGSSEVKTRAFMGDILNKIDEIEEIEQENINLSNQIEAMKLKNESEIAQLKNQLTQIETESEQKLANALKSNQKKYEGEIEELKNKYAQIENDLIKKLNALKREQSINNNNLRSELSKIKASIKSSQVMLSKKIKDAENESKSKIQNKELEIQSLKSNNYSEIKPEVISSSNYSTSIRRKLSQSKQKVSQPQTPKSIQSPRKMILANKDEKIDISDTKAIMEKINNSENISHSKISEYSELKNNFQSKIIKDQSNASIQISEIKNAKEIAQSELNNLIKDLNQLQQSINNSMTNSEVMQNQKDEINNKKDEINRFRVDVNKRKTLQAIQSHHHQEIDEIDESIKEIIRNSFSFIHQKNDSLLNEQKKTNESIIESLKKLDAILKELKEVKLDEEESAIKERQKWGDIRTDIANSTIDICNQSKPKNQSRPTSSLTKSRPIVSGSKLPPLQKSQS